MDLKEFPAFVAETFNVRAINPLLDHFTSTDAASIDAFRAGLEKAHSQIVDLGLGGKRFYAEDAAIRKEAVVFGKKCIDVAVQVGSPSVRQHVAGHAGEKPDVSLAASRLGEIAEYGARRNIVVGLENDSPGSEDPYFLVANRA
jgi:sugar phosphate isomerase/epimerase